MSTLSTYCLFRVIQIKWHGKLKGQPYSGRSFTNFTSRCNISLPNWWLHFQSRCTWWLLVSLISWQWAVDVTNSTYFAGQWAMRSSCFCFPKRKAEEEKQQWSLIHAVNQGQWQQLTANSRVLIIRARAEWNLPGHGKGRRGSIWRSHLEKGENKRAGRQRGPSIHHFN